ncbi:hypothetical protein E3N88_09163 [Mikania micrantha]|uniref:Uncharacterized protein n=1 Tax=Mikania micrantha TaxID=192012 RepID=A0A5N6PJ78_9ASTR|nr:hypothetical protein E3N88_09163 [Mikania micrantha]
MDVDKEDGFCRGKCFFCTRRVKAMEGCEVQPVATKKKGRYVGKCENIRYERPEAFRIEPNKVIPTMYVQEHSDKLCVWHAADFADGTL